MKVLVDLILSRFLPSLDGYKTYVAGVGLACLAVYQVTVGEYERAVESVMLALTAFGVGHKLDKATGVR